MLRVSSNLERKAFETFEEESKYKHFELRTFKHFTTFVGSIFWIIQVIAIWKAWSSYCLWKSI